MKSRSLLLAVVALCVLEAGATPLDPLMSAIEAAVDRDPRYLAESARIQSQFLQTATRFSRDRLSWKLSASGGVGAVPAVPRFSLPASAGLTLGFENPRQQALLSLVEAAERAVAAAELERAYSEASYRVIAACLRAAEAGMTVTRAEARARRAEQPAGRPRGAGEDAARAAFLKAGALRDLQTASRAAIVAAAEARSLLGTDPPSFDELAALIDALAREGPEEGLEIRLSRASANAAEASAEAFAAEATALSFFIALSGDLDLLSPATAEADLTLGLGFAPAGRAVQAAARARSSAVDAAVSKLASAREEGRRTRERLQGDLASALSALEYAEAAVAAARALEGLARDRLELGAGTIGDYLGAQEQTNASELSRDGLRIGILELKLETARLGGLRRPSLERGVP